MGSIFETVKDLDAQRDALKAKKEKIIQTYQDKCPHPLLQIVENRWGSPEFRVCRRCGYAEDGYGCGYWKLAPNEYGSIPGLDDSEARKFVLRKLNQEQINAIRYPELTQEQAAARGSAMRYSRWKKENACA